MNIDYTGRHVQLDDRVKDYTAAKLSKVLRFLDEPIEVHAVFEVEKHRHRAELHVAHRHGLIQAAEEADEMLDAIHAVVDKVGKQARRGNKKHLSQKRRAGLDGAGRAAAMWPVDVLDGTTVGDGREPRIIKSSQLPIKPMTLDEAAIELQGSKNDFFVFRDAVTDRVSVLYRRKDRNYGLIAPEA